MHAANMQPPIDKGILRTPLKIDFHRSLLDTGACETFTEVIVTDATPLRARYSAEVGRGEHLRGRMMVTDQDDWLFNADNYLKFLRSENWSVIPRDRVIRARRSRRRQRLSRHLLGQ